VATLSTKRLLPERQPQASGPLAQVRLWWKVTISVSENKSMFVFYLRIIIHICPPLVINYQNSAFVGILCIYWRRLRFWRMLLPEQPVHVERIQRIE
jgi:hypothetical protein